MRTLLVVIACGLVGSAMGCGGDSAESQGTLPPETAVPETAVPDRAAAPPIEGVSLDGAAVSLADFAGRPVLVNVWSSW